MSFTNLVKAIPALQLDASTIASGTYVPINVDGLPEACFLIKILNNSTTDVWISYEPGVDHERLLGRGATVTFPATTLEVNCLPSGMNRGYGAFTKGQVVYVNGVAGVGEITLMAYYQERI